jgi:hypothetical protein
MVRYDSPPPAHPPDRCAPGTSWYSLQDYGLISILAMGGAYCTNWALNYLNYTTRIVFKSCRVIPVMAFRRCGAGAGVPGRACRSWPAGLAFPYVPCRSPRCPALAALDAYTAAAFLACSNPFEPRGVRWNVSGGFKDAATCQMRIRCPGQAGGQSN